MLMNSSERLSTDPAISHGKPCIKGTRVLVSSILDNLATGVTPAAILASYPSLCAEDIETVRMYGLGSDRAHDGTTRKPPER